MTFGKSSYRQGYSYSRPSKPNKASPPVEKKGMIAISHLK